MNNREVHLMAAESWLTMASKQLPGRLLIDHTRGASDEDWHVVFHGTDGVRKVLGSESSPGAFAALCYGIQLGLQLPKKGEQSCHSETTVDVHQPPKGRPTLAYTTARRGA